MDTTEEDSIFPSAQESQLAALSNRKPNHLEVFLLTYDADGTLRSSNESFGVAVTSEAEAKRFVKDGGLGFTHSYEKITIFTDKDEALKFKEEAK